MALLKFGNRWATTFEDDTKGLALTKRRWLAGEYPKNWLTTWVVDVPEALTRHPKEALFLNDRSIWGSIGSYSDRHHNGLREPPYARQRIVNNLGFPIEELERVEIHAFWGFKDCNMTTSSISKKDGSLSLRWPSDGKLKHFEPLIEEIRLDSPIVIRKHKTWGWSYEIHQPIDLSSVLFDARPYRKVNNQGSGILDAFQNSLVMEIKPLFPSWNNNYIEIEYYRMYKVPNTEVQGTSGWDPHYFYHELCGIADIRFFKNPPP